jgi:hypothetical protein
MIKQIMRATGPGSSCWNRGPFRLTMPSGMKTFLVLLLSLAALVLVAAIFIFDIFSEIGSHRVTGTQKAPLASLSMSREEYIAYLLRTEKQDDPELWRRIAAVRNLKNWPER